MINYSLYCMMVRKFSGVIVLDLHIERIMSEFHNLQSNSAGRSLLRQVKIAHLQNQP